MLIPARTCARFAPCALGAALFFGVPAAAAAQSAPAVAPSPSPLPEIGHVVTSDRQDEPAALSARTTFVVTKSDMIRNGWQNVGEAIEALPGVTLIRYGAFGAQISAEIRGSSSNGVLVLLDGRPVAGVNLGGVDLSMFSTTGVERVEVVEGPGATLYGSGAAGGVVNIITLPGHGSYAAGPELNLQAGTFGERAISIESRWFSFEQQYASNNYPYTLPDGTSAVRANADYLNTSARLNGSAKLGGLDVTGSAGITSRHVGVPGGIGFLTLGERQNDGLENALAIFALRRAHATLSLELSGSRERIAALDDNPLDAATAGNFDALSIEARTQLSLRNVVAAADSRLVYGVDLARSSVRNDDGFGNVAVNALAQSAIYAQESLRIGAAGRLYAGLRAEHDAAFGGSIAPSLGLAVALGEGFTLRANAATAFRAPSAAELYFPNFGNPLLQSERTSGGDVSLVATRFLGGASVGWFVQNGRDLIAYDPLANTDVNISRSSVAGVTLDIATLPYNGFTTKFNLTDTYRALDLTGAATRLRYRPVLVTNLELTYAPAHRDVLDGLGFVVHSEGLRDPAGALPYTRFDAYARFRLAPRALLSVRVFDIGNEQYQAVAGYPVAGRSFGVSLATR